MFMPSSERTWYEGVGVGIIGSYNITAVKSGGKGIFLRHQAKTFLEVGKRERVMTVANGGFSCRYKTCHSHSARYDHLPPQWRPVNVTFSTEQFIAERGKALKYSSRIANFFPDGSILLRSRIFS